LPLFDGQFDNFTTYLSADLHLDNRLNLAIGNDDFGQVVPRDLFRLDGHHDEGDARKNEGFTAFSGVCHLILPYKTRAASFCFIRDKRPIRAASIINRV
jgi:hypothetical protein